jgi:hypothetical protein
MKLVFFLLVIVIFNVLSVLSDGRRGFINSIRIEPTVGEVWPKPQSIKTTNQQFSLHPDTFNFVVNETSEKCDLLTNAFVRYYKIIFYPHTYLSSILHSSTSKTDDNMHRPRLKTVSRKKLFNSNDIPVLKDLYVNVEQPCDQWPHLESNESCY